MVSKELIDLYNKYRQEVGIAGGAEAAAILTLAHCIRDLRRVFVVNYEGSEKNIATAVDHVQPKREG